MKMNQGGRLPLQGLRVIDWTTAVAAPMAGRLLADMGAEVLKVEAPGGDMYRTYGIGYGMQITAEENPLFTNENSNKRFIAVDMKQPAGKQVLYRLLEDADVLLTNVRYRSLEKLGLSYDDLKERFPRLIFAHFNGYGYFGPDAARPGFDMAAFWARSGGLLDWVSDGEHTINPSMGVGDITSSTMLYAGILTALYAREQTGRGTHVTSSLYANGIWINGNNVMATQERFGYQMPEPITRKPSPFSNCCYRCKDGKWIALAITPYDRYWRDNCEMFGLEAYLEDPRFCTYEAVLQGDNREVLYEMVRQRMLLRTRAEWMELFRKKDVVCEAVAKLEDVSRDPQAWDNQYLERVAFLTGQEAVLPTVPLQFSEYTVKKISPAGGLGRDTDAVLAEYGFSPEAIAWLKEAKAVF